MRKAEFKVIRPSESLASLQEFNKRVVMLTNIVDILLSKFSGKIENYVSEILKERNDLVKEFYKD